MSRIAQQKIAPFFWFDRQAEEAATFYISVFADSGIKQIVRYGNAGQGVHGMPAGSVMTVEFELAGQTFVALNGGPHFQFSEAVSFRVLCETQEEIDYFWSKLTQGGQEGACGWLKDRFGVSWQIVPSALASMMADVGGGKSERVMNALLQMKKLDLPALQRAYGASA